MRYLVPVDARCGVVVVIIIIGVVVKSPEIRQRSKTDPA